MKLLAELNITEKLRNLIIIMSEQYPKIYPDRQIPNSAQPNNLAEPDIFDLDEAEDDLFDTNEISYNPQKEKEKRKKSSLFKGIKGISRNFERVNQNVAGEVAKLGQKVTKSANELSQGVAKSAKGISQEVVKRSQDVAKSATDLSQEMTKSALQQGKNVQQEAREIFGNKLEKNQETISKKLEENQFAKEASAKAFIDKINIEEVEKTVDELWDKFPYEPPEKISQKLLMQQILRVSKNSAVTTVVPGKIAETVGIDYVAIALMEKEIIFQIAAAYGFDIWHPNRKKEAFAIIDRVLRSTRSGRIVVSLSQMIPLAGQFMNVGTDAFLVYVIGNTARKFYEAKSQEASPGETLAAFIEKTERQCKQRLW